MIHFLKEAGHQIEQGLDVYVNGNIPNGSGLSSSASLELLMGVIAEKLFDLKLDRLDLVKIGMQTENDFITRQRRAFSSQNNFLEIFSCIFLQHSSYC